MQSLFGFDLSTAQKWVIAFGVILILLVLLGLFARQIKDGRLRIRGQGGGRARQPRLGVVDIHDLDRQRQLVLIRRDNVEHLVMIGGASDVVVETNIVRSGGRAALPVQADLGMPDRPLPFDTLVPPDALRPDPAEDLRRAPPPAPVAVASSGGELLSPQRPLQPAPRPVQPPHADSALAAATVAGVGAALAGAAASRAQPAPPLPTPLPPAPSVQPPQFTREPAPTVSAGELDDMARQLDEALKRPFSAVRPAKTPIDAPAEPVAAPKPADHRAQPPVKPAPAAIPAAAPPSSAARAVPADVEAELEMALGLKPERISPKPASFAPSAYTAPKPFEPVPPAETKPSKAPEPVAKEAAPEPEPKPEAEPQLAEVKPTVPAAGKQVDEPEPAAEKAAAPEAEEVAPEPKAQATSESKPEPEAEPKQIDPFSVDAIEAEFARLLGRDPKSGS
ncbi:hypothetical protein ASE63_09015 [Bosea sp. Root381]|uniref:hypothetical protein n=1 Tax=Bosea sp. Root381 TaxID=1736524 RepID=UPI000712A34D|nr:hypothetical protein [Bosea sp. Root381]KRE00214.1 hypothetical protein ASE63_09015 [Bosea sp. Root381]